MKSHLRYSHLPEPELHDIFLDIIWQSPAVRHALKSAQTLNYPKWRIVSGALYNTVWNHLSGRADMYGVKDIDLMYFDPDTSWQAEDKAIRSATGFPKSPPVEIRNQARVHLWYEQHFGHKIPPLERVEQAIDSFASKTHCVGVRLENDALNLYAPHGLRDIFAFRITPNPVGPNRETHERKGVRALECWPELDVVTWE
ncbi:MAG: nucleotidyltransferase family protein [Paracoccaceae bacterium]